MEIVFDSYSVTLVRSASSWSRSCWVDIEKLHDYCLNPTHPRGRHRARVLASALHTSQADAEWLKTKLLEAALHFDIIEGEADEHGRRYTLDFQCAQGDRSAVIRSGWIVRLSENFPRLTTCYVVSEWST